MPFNCFSNFRISHMEEVKLEPIESEPESNVSHWKELEESSSDNFVDVKPDYLNSDQPQPFLFIKQENLHFDVDQKGLERFKDEEPDQIIEANDSLAEDELRESWIEDNDLKEESSSSHEMKIKNEGVPVHGDEDFIYTTKEFDTQGGIHNDEMLALKCKLCDFRTSNSQELNIHTRKHYQNTEHECMLCDFSTPLEFCLRRHVDLKHPKKDDQGISKLKCYYCSHISSSRIAWTHHVSYVHLKGRPHICHLCDYKAKIKQHLEHHLSSVHFKIRPYECESCTFSTSLKRSLKNHKRKIHGIV